MIFYIWRTMEKCDLMPVVVDFTEKPEFVGRASFHFISVPEQPRKSRKQGIINITISLIIINIIIILLKLKTKLWIAFAIKNKQTNKQMVSEFKQMFPFSSKANFYE